VATVLMNPFNNRHWQSIWAAGEAPTSALQERGGPC
jgi:hypothetical protein